ncbi:MAG: hypothetical protein KDD63_27555, partial [Bacteroidetes bacterium]|nr:hypothetical protein [Bacteroidota bacterium]
MAQIQSDSTIISDSTQVPILSSPGDTIPDSLGMSSSPFDSLTSDSMGMGMNFPGGMNGDSTVAKTPQQKYVDSLKATSDLKASVTYKGQDSIVYDVDKGIFYLYENAELQYDEIDLKAKRVRIDVNKQTLYANGVTDSLGNEQGRPEFTQDGQTYNAWQDHVPWEQVPSMKNPSRGFVFSAN